MENNSDSGTLKFSKPTPNFPKGGEEIKDGEFVSPVKEETTSLREAADRWVTNNPDGEVRRMYGHYVRAFMAGGEWQRDQLLKENQELKALSRELLTAIEQSQFFTDGFSQGSASISEVRNAYSEQHKAYSALWNYLKSKAQ